MFDEYRNVDGFDWYRYGNRWYLDTGEGGAEVFVLTANMCAYVYNNGLVYRFDASEDDIEDVLREVSLWYLE